MDPHLPIVSCFLGGWSSLQASKPQLIIGVLLSK
jgi:hypothetical protein